MRKKVGYILLALCTVFVVLFVFIVARICTYSILDEAKKSDAIVVLGAAEYDGKPSPVLRARLDHAYDLYKRGFAKIIITTGGLDQGEKYSEGITGKNYLTKLGIPANSIFADENSLTTKQNLSRVKELAIAHSINSLILVSDPFHMYRAKLIAENLGLNVLTSPTLTSPISKNTLLNIHYILRETIGVALHSLFGI